MTDKLDISRSHSMISYLFKLTENNVKIVFSSKSFILS